MNYTEMEAKVREATNNEPWGIHTASRYPHPRTDVCRRILVADAGDCQWHLQLVSGIVPMSSPVLIQKPITQ